MAISQKLGATMTARLIIFISIISTNVCQGQKSSRLSSADSISISKTWADIVKTLADKNSTELKKYCFDKINCTNCISFDQLSKIPVDNFNVPVDTFVKTVFSMIPDSRLWTLIKSDQKKIGTSKIYKELQTCTKTGPNTTVYSIWFVTYKPKELGPKHGGVQVNFEFIKTNSKFRLCGFNSTP